MADGVANVVVDGVKDDARVFLRTLLSRSSGHSLRRKTAKQGQSCCCCCGGAAAEATDSVVLVPGALNTFASGCRRRSVCKGVRRANMGFGAGVSVACVTVLLNLQRGIASFLD